MHPDSQTHSLSLTFFTLVAGNTKRIALVLAVLLWAATAAPSLAITYTTLDDPLATRGTNAIGVDGSSFVGEYEDDVMAHGFVYNGSTYTTLNDPLAGSNETSPSGISGNNIVGTYFDNSTGYRGFLYNGTTYTTLDDPLETQGTYAYGISGNNIVGTYNIAPPVFGAPYQYRGFLYNGSAYTTLNDPLAGPQGTGTLARGISGDNIVGTFYDSLGKSHGFLYNGTSYTTLDDPLGTNGTNASGISGNNIVGYYIDSVGPHGFLYNGAAYTTLDDPLAATGNNSGTYAYGISGNNIVGNYSDSSDGGHGFLATVPEPSTFMLAALAAVGFAAIARRRQRQHNCIPVRTGFMTLVLAALLWAATASPSLAVTLDMVTVGNPGNAPDTRYDATGFGSVDHTYRIGKYETTAGQYTEFLNAVAKADPNGLYNPAMGDPSASLGTHILQSGSSPNFSYSIAADWANRPVNFTTFWDVARFANWLDNGQPTGPQGPGTTEGGAYINVGNQATFARQPGARFFIPTEDEWYKAAYHNKSAGLAASYFDYPTGSNTAPINTLPDTGNHANFYDAVGTGNGGYSIGSPYYRTNVGDFANSASPYGTFDQGGNVIEWNETSLFGSTRGLRGGASSANSDGLLASGRYNGDPAYDDFSVGFRVASIASVPEPPTCLLLLTGILTMCCRRRVAVP